MARAISFDYGRALDSAVELFWRHGYAGTSLRGLLKVMGIGEGSFYNSLHSKKRLYVACLERYEQVEGRKRVEALMGATTAKAGIRAMFGAVLDCLDDARTPSRLCMLSAMLSEDVLADLELRKRVEDGLAGFEALIAERLRHDREAHLLPSSLDPPTIAAVITTFVQGLWRMALVDFDRVRFEGRINAFLGGMGL